MCAARRSRSASPNSAHHLDEPAAADVVAAGKRVDVALGVDRQARVGADHRHQRLVEPAFVGELQVRDVDPLHEHVGAVRPEADAADVHEVAGAGEQRHEPPAMEARRREHEIVEVAGAHPGIVGDVDVAGPHRLERKAGDEMAHRFGHRVDVPGGAGDGLRQHPAVAVEHAGREVAGLAHDRREGGAQQDLRLLLDDRDEAAPHHLEVDFG